MRRLTPFMTLIMAMLAAPSTPAQTDTARMVVPFAAD